MDSILLLHCILRRRKPKKKNKARKKEGDILGSVPFSLGGKKREMGNCINRQKSVTWVDDDDDDWEWAESPVHCSRKEKAGAAVEEKKKGFFEGKGGAASMEVKVKITKQQLEELLQKVEGKGLGIQQVLADLLSMPEVILQERHQHWRPALQSIPE